MLAIGLMSGTSMDGIDCALIQTDGTPGFLKTLDHISVPYDNSFKISLKSTEYVVKKCQGDLQNINKYFSEFIAEYLKHELKLSFQDFLPPYFII